MTYDPDTAPLEVKQFVIAFRTKTPQYEDFPTGASDKSRVRLILDIEKRLKFKENRKKVLQALMGIAIQSQNQLTQSATSALIGVIEDETTNGLSSSGSAITLIERIIETHPGTNPWNLFPWQREEEDSEMPPVPEDAPF